MLSKPWKIAYNHSKLTNLIFISSLDASFTLSVSFIVSLCFPRAFDRFEPLCDTHQMNCILFGRMARLIFASCRLYVPNERASEHIIRSIRRISYASRVFCLCHIRGKRMTCSNLHAHDSLHTCFVPTLAINLIAFRLLNAMLLCILLRFHFHQSKSRAIFNAPKWHEIARACARHGSGDQKRRKEKNMEPSKSILIVW